MCGIVGYIGTKEACPVLMDCLGRLEYRGYDSAGIAVADTTGAFHIEKTAGKLQNLRHLLDQQQPMDSTTGIGHTRWATHGVPSDCNSHPHRGKRVALVHNGIVENQTELLHSLKAQGLVPVSETDSELIALLFDTCPGLPPMAAIRQVLAQVRGSYALAILFEDMPGHLYAARKDSPIVVGVSKGEQFLASDCSAFLPYTRKYAILEDGDLADLTADHIRIYHQNGDLITREVHTASWNLSAAEKGGFAHFMRKEIDEQPRVVLHTAHAYLKDGRPDFSGCGLTEQDLKQISCMHIIGCGTAVHAGMIGKSLIEELCRIPVNVEVASEFRYRNPVLHSNDVVLAISQSGETSDTLAALRMAKQQGCLILAVVNVVGSSIAREADRVLYTYAGPEISVASTKAYSAQLMTLSLLAMSIALAKNPALLPRLSHTIDSIEELPAAMNSLLQEESAIRAMAKKLVHCRDLYYIGRGLDYAMSLEGSLKLKEISYLHSEAYAAGELKHGAISLIEQGTPVIALATQDHVLAKTLSNVQEIRSRGARVLLICKKNVHLPNGLADSCILLPDMDELLMPLLTVIVLQLFAYEMAVCRGCDVDQPRNLAKSVTVE